MLHTCHWLSILSRADALGTVTKNRSLRSCFTFFQTFDATVNHDRVYDWLGMTRWHIEQQPFPAQIIPAYERLINQVPADATRVATEEAGDSWLFRYIDLHELPRSSHPPSWVPQLFRNVDSAVDPNNFRSTFNASEGMATSYSELFATFDLSLQEHDWSRMSA